ncbi:Amino acid transporter, transmembrane [Kalmanozyma brasiliensis GHG001]|uniref:Amino acid transporter transmembrane domain-containing protein n=1 Tax=Kalmanozyma brasiliensis (strain GHG001) TaxID=1365824 RepID=V5GFH3_KALBG|nr:Amino acid transporter, transmembrane [Kalmanozyma brasiliensis GHG001]EST04772.1 Amino acid transporter, transmembrane [Kalmanozyma brasiliensis GHG001]
MPSRTNKGIPVPRDAARGRSGDGQQAAWRSSLDLVWSYSRSQAFYGNNIATSPSFVERRWAGQDLEEADSIYEDDEEFTDEEDDYASTSQSRASDAGTDTASMASDARFGPEEEFEWEGELPPNAVQRTRRRSKARDRRLEQLESADEDERSRSRSRSPKRLSGVKDRVPGKADPSRRSQLSTASEVLRDPFADDAEEGSGSKDSEVTPLMTQANSTRRKSSGYGTIRRTSESGALSTRSGDSNYPPPDLGNSTLLQSWFNTVNALVGVGILALPLAFSYAGWVGGTLLFLVCGLLTNYTGKVLAKIMSKEPSLRTYADIGSYAFGPSARVLISLFFCLELWAVSVALIILFGDSMSAIFPNVAPAAFKMLGYAVVLPSVFLPLKLLSPISVIGIVSTFTLVVVVISDGLIKHHAPGSLFEPAPTTLGPRWSRLPLSFGLIMSGFSSHPIIPSLVRDMKDPSKFPRMLNLAYAAATVLYLSMGMVGYAMFGMGVSDEITKDLARTPGFPRVLNSVAIWLIVVNPLSKFALATRPIQTTFEILLGVDEQIALRVRSKRRRSSAAIASGVKAPNGESNVGTESNGDGGSSKATDQESATTVESTTAQRVSFASPSSPTPTTPIADDNPLANSSISLRAASRTSGLTPRTRSILRFTLKIALTLLIALTAVVLPGFEQVMAFLGAFLAFATCVFGPLLANLRLFGKEMRAWRVGVDVIILGVSGVMAVTGTIWAFL